MNESLEKIDKYRILKRLGEGGFGAVYLCHDHDMERDVAIKVFRPRDVNLVAFATSSSEDGLQVLRERFKREARILARLHDNPYIVSALEFGETENGSPWYAMDYVPDNLQQRLGKDVFDRAGLEDLDQSAHPRALPLEQCLTLLHQVLQGMKAAHAHGLVHRDIKPSNILLSDAGEVRIADFGIAKEPDTQISVSRVAMGSRNYMAPEQRESAKHVDGRADIYSIGVLAYRMLTGKLPTGRYADPDVAVPQLGKALNGVILKALSEDKETRFRDAGEMLAAYEAALQQRTREDQSAYTGTFTDLSIDSPVSGVAEKFRPLYELIDSTLLEYGDVEPKLGQLQGMAAVAGLDNEALQSAIRDRIQGDQELQGMVNLHKLIQKEIAASTDSVKDLVMMLLPAAELAGKDRAWLEARLQAAAAEQDSSRSSPQAASHRTSKHVAGSPDADLGKRRVLPAAAAVFAVVTVSVVGLWFWSGGLDDAGRSTPTRSVGTETLPPPADVSQSPSTGSGDRTDAVVSRPEQTGLTLAELTAGNSIFQVTTNEPGVTVLLDGVELGRTPLSREDLRPGSYTLSLQSAYYVDREMAVTLADGVVFKEDYVLQVTTGQLTVLSEPAGAAVYIDDQDTGEVTPVTLNDVVAGTRALSLRLEGYQTTAAQTVTVEEEQTAQVSETLRKTWRLTVNTTPGDAAIRLPDISPAYRPGMDLLPGEYRVEVSAPEHVSQTRTVPLVDSDQVLNIVLEPVLYPVTITSNVTDARITLRGNGNDYTYRNGLRLPAGSYQVSAMAERYSPLSEIWEVSENSTRLNIVLEQVLYPVTITSNVTDARITLSGNGNDYTYQNGLRLPAGSYQVSVMAERYSPLSETWQVSENNTRLVLELESIVPEPGGTFRDPLADGGEGPLMVVLSAGRFRMGCLNDDDDCYDDEKPVHDVTLPNNFAMAVYEVSFAEYDRYVQATGARRPGDEGWGRGNRPVINVDWEEARAYARWLSEQTGRSYRLPTEAEWEYAARAGTTTKYSWGNRANHEQANYGTDECCSGLVQGSDRWEYTAPVGSFPANGFGLYDMHGNVWEWTQDCWHDSYRGAPTNGQDWEGANGGDCDRRVVRGGSWGNNPGALRAANRFGNRVSFRILDLGLRLVQDLP